MDNSSVNKMSIHSCFWKIFAALPLVNPTIPYQRSINFKFEKLKVGIRIHKIHILLQLIKCPKVNRRPNGSYIVYIKYINSTKNILSPKSNFIFFGDLPHSLPHDFRDLHPVYHIYHIWDLICYLVEMYR